MKPINRVGQIPNGYLTDQGRCRISEREAGATLAWLHDQGVSLASNPKTRQDDLMQRSFLDLIEVVAAYKRGAIEGPEARQGNVPPASIPAETSLDAFGEPVASETIAPLPSDLAEAMDEASPPSAMNFDALKRVEPFGKITPPLPGALLLCDELAVPVPNGFTNTLHVPRCATKTKREFQSGSSNGERTIIYPIKSPAPEAILPVPLGHVAQHVEQQGERVSFALPRDDDPLLVRASGQGPFSFNVTDKNVSRQKVDFSQFRPSREEQEYLQSILPLPENLKKELKAARSPEEILNLAASWLAAKDPKTGLTNLRYACDPAYGEFIRDNSKHLPLIMSELKAGHCDLLTWYTGLLLRSYGVTAWRGTALTTTHDGSALNKSYKHAVVILERSDGTSGFFDPTKYVDLDPAYHPAVLPQERVQAMSGKFKAAGSDEERAAILQEFNAALEPLRQQGESHPAVLSDFYGLNGEQLPALQEARNANLGQDSMEVHVAPVSWDELPRQVTPETLLAVAGSMGDTFPYNEPANIVSNARNPLWRKRIAWLARGLQETHCSAPYSQVTPNGHFDVKTSLEVYLAENPRDPFCARDQRHAFPASVRTKFPTSSDLLQSLGYPAPSQLRLTDQHALNEDILDFDLGKFLGGANATVRSHRYTKLFRDSLAKGTLKKHFFDISAHREVVELDLFTPDSTAEAEKIITSPENAAARCVQDQLVFGFEYQLASLSPEYRASLMKKLGISPQILRKLSLDHLGFDDRSTRVVLNHPAKLKAGEDRHHALVRTSFDMFSLSNSCKERFFRHLAQSARELNMDSAHASTPDDYRGYAKGDDVRQIDWNISARSDHVFVKAVPARAKGERKVLHVMLDTYGTMKGVTVLQFHEILEGLKRLSRSHGFDVYVSGSSGDSYVKLTQDVPSKELLTRLMASGKRPRVGPWLQHGRFPENFLFVSGSGARMSAMRHLGFGECKNLRTIYLNEEPFTVFPLANEQWVAKGFSAKTQELGQKLEETRKFKEEMIKGLKATQRSPRMSFPSVAQQPGSLFQREKLGEWSSPYYPGSFGFPMIEDR